jgi:hypothetical protein
VELLHPARRVEPPFREGRSRIDTRSGTRSHRHNMQVRSRSNPRNGNAERDDRADDLHARGSVPRRTRPPVKAPRMTQDPCGILRVQAAASAVLPPVTAGFLVPGRVSSRVACRIRQEPDQRSRARAPACRRGRMADLDATAGPARGAARRRAILAAWLTTPHGTGPSTTR